MELASSTLKQLTAAIRTETETDIVSRNELSSQRITQHHAFFIYDVLISVTVSVLTMVSGGGPQPSPNRGASRYSEQVSKIRA